MQTVTWQLLSVVTGVGLTLPANPKIRENGQPD